MIMSTIYDVTYVTQEIPEMGLRLSDTYDTVRVPNQEGNRK